jgi:ribosome-binding factor A
VSTHKDQLASVILRAVQSVLSRGLNDPRVRGLVSVTSVHVSDDLANATIMVSVLPAEFEELSIHGLRHAARHIRSEIGKNVRMRRIPQLAFKLDKSLKKEAEIIAAIDNARRSDQNSADAQHEDGADTPEGLDT